VADGQAVGTIANDDSVVLPSLSIGDVTVTEGNGGTSLATFTVSLSAPSASAVSFDIASANNSAAAGSDYVALALAGQVITAGNTSRTFNVTINGDTAVEANERLRVNLSAASGATIADAQAVGTLLNDDGPTLSIANVSVAEGASGQHAMTFTVRLSQPAAVPVTYTVATANGSAVVGSDYVGRLLTGETIPAIGFVGTVRGIGESLQQAHKAVEGDVSGVVAGLGISFNSTMVALALSILVMFLLHQIQLRQERAVLDTEEFLDTRVVRQMLVK
jgi:hypothetical protein